MKLLPLSGPRAQEVFKCVVAQGEDIAFYSSSNVTPTPATKPVTCSTQTLTVVMKQVRRVVNTGMAQFRRIPIMLTSRETSLDLRFYEYSAENGYLAQTNPLNLKRAMKSNLNIYYRKML